MTTVQTRTREIGDKEDFDIIVTRKLSGKPVNPAENGLMRKYPFDKKAKGTQTINDWKKKRFERKYPGLSCHVLNGDGTKAAPQTKLETVRASYEA